MDKLMEKNLNLLEVHSLNLIETMYRETKYLNNKKVTESEIKKTITKFKKIINIIKNKEIPEEFPEEFYEYTDTSTILLRDFICLLQGYTLISKNWIREMAKFLKNKKVLEIMAGCGSLTYALQQEGVDIIATDNYSWNYEELKYFDRYYCNVEKIDCIDAIEKYGKDFDYIICSWPYIDDLAFNCINKMREINSNLKMIYIGEDRCGCTANDKFFDTIHYIHNDQIDYINLFFKSWFMFHDNIYLLS